MKYGATLVCGAAILAIGCGGGNSGGDPMPPAPSGTVVSIAVTSSGPTLFLGATEMFSAVVTYSSGATQTLSGGAWTTDTPAVALVEASTGRVGGIANGEVTISVAYQGVRGSKHVRVLPNYGASWVGNYTVVSCTQTEGFADQNVCGSFNPGQTFQYTLLFSQDADVVSGRTAVGLLGSTTASANVNVDGSLTFNPQVFVGSVGIDLVWKLTCVQANVINGTVTETWRDLSTTGQMVIEGALQSPTRQSLARTVAIDGPRRSLAEAVAAVKSAITSGP